MLCLYHELKQKPFCIINETSMCFFLACLVKGQRWLVTVAMHPCMVTGERAYVLKLLAKRLITAAAGTQGAEHRREQSGIQMVYGLGLPTVL